MSSIGLQRRHRRKFLSLTASAAGATILSRIRPLHALTETTEMMAVRLADAAPIAHIPSDFIGLGYEMSSAAKLGLLSVSNDRYVRLVRHLSGNGVFRIGGIVADHSRYTREGTVSTEPTNTVVTRASLEQFAAFLRKTGWSAIWSVDFATGTLENAVAEAKDVARILGPHLLALEIGNEVENYGRGNPPSRTPPYTYQEYREEYRRWHAGISGAVPGVRFAAPDTAASVEWVQRMAADAKKDVQLLTTHYYRGAQAKGTMEQLATPDPELSGKLEKLRQAARESGIPYRICETNSFFGGGRPGLSDTLLGALWLLDYMMLLARYGCAGVNVETGVNQLGFVSSYSPIQDDGKGRNYAGVPYYGMLACAMALRDAPEVLPLDVDAQGRNVTVYALGHLRTLRSLTIVNRDSGVAVVGLPKIQLTPARAYRLAGPSALSQSGVTFAGTAVDGSGSWIPKQPEALRESKVAVPTMSAVVLRFA
jgi:hypothetical protein